MNNETDVGNGRQRLNGAEAFGFSFDRGFFKNDDVAAGSRIGLMNFDGKPALSSVVNYLVIAHDLHPFALLAQNFGGSSLQAATMIRETGASSQAIAGALLCAVPVISYALVRAGDMAVGQLVGGLMQPAQSAATSQGVSIAAVISSASPGPKETK